jgi:hypothetical protein
MPELSPIYQVQITKVKTATGFATLEVDTEQFSDEVMYFLVSEGLKAVINSRMTKVGAVTKLTGKELLAAHEIAMKIANENLDDLKSGKVKHSRGKEKSTIPAAVRAEAMRLAKTAIKDWVRSQGEKPSRFDEKSYTSKAKEYVDSDPAYLTQAKENIEARKTPSFNLNLNMSDLGPKLVKKAKLTDLPVGAMPKAGVQTVHRSVN